MAPARIIPIKRIDRTAPVLFLYFFKKRRKCLKTNKKTRPKANNRTMIHAENCEKVNPEPGSIYPKNIPYLQRISIIFLDSALIFPFQSDFIDKIKKILHHILFSLRVIEN